MLKINKAFLCIYFSFCTHHFLINAEEQQSLQKMADDILYNTEDQLEYDLNDFELPLTQEKLTVSKRTRYVYLQNKCLDYCIVAFIYYLNLKEKWYNFWGKLYKKCHKVMRYLIYCS